LFRKKRKKGEEGEKREERDTPPPKNFPLLASYLLPTPDRQIKVKGKKKGNPGIRYQITKDRVLSTGTQRRERKGKQRRSGRWGKEREKRKIRRETRVVDRE